MYISFFAVYLIIATPKKAILLLCGVLTLFLFCVSREAEAARLILSPSTGTFSIGSTLDISVYLDTEGESVNAFEIGILFPPDKLQVVSPSTGKSIVRVWTAPPLFNNRTGELHFVGGIPGGINVSQGLISTITFRVSGTGDVLVKFEDETRVLLNDGAGTDVLKDAGRGVYNLSLPPPQGPIVASETHPDQSRWYPLSQAILHWTYTDEPISGYSYILSSSPIDTPDNTVEGANTSVSYKSLSDGVHYFHIKALRSGVWGGTTHFGLQVDTTPPASFPIQISPSKRTTSKNPVVRFETTDEHSSIDYYEYKVISLTPRVVEAATGDIPFFIVTEGQEILELDIGSYDIIARAYDKAGNVREEIEKLQIVTPLLQFVNGDGVRFFGAFNIPWLWIFIILCIIAIILGHEGRRVYKWHRFVEERREHKKMPTDVEEKLRELQEYRKKYGKIVNIVLVLVLGIFFFGNSVSAQTQKTLPPPLVTTVSKNITNEEIFYVGGKTALPNVEVIIYLQGLKDGEAFSYVVSSDADFEWFYRHQSFLQAGSYLLWAQTRVGEEVSPPTAQITLIVEPTAIQFGASRISFELLYFLLAALFFAVIIGLGSFIAYHSYHGKKKHQVFMKEVREAEESVKRGFAVLKRDIEAELYIIKKAKFTKELSEEEKQQEEQLLKDLAWAEQYIGKEVWDIEHVEQSS